MTRRSIVEYAQALRPKYLKSSKEGKGKILDEFIQITGLHRKAAIRLLNCISWLSSNNESVQYGLYIFNIHLIL